MSLVQIKGTFIGANMKRSEFDGKVTYATQIDIYQQDSPSNNKMISVKADDDRLAEHFVAAYAIGDEIVLDCSISAYKNQAYFKLVKEIA